MYIDWSLRPASDSEEHGSANDLKSDPSIEELLGETAVVRRRPAGCRMGQPEVEIEYGANEGVAFGDAQGLRLRRAAASSSLSRLR